MASNGSKIGAGAGIAAVILLLLLGLGASGSGDAEPDPAPSPPVPGGPALYVWLLHGPLYYAEPSGIRERRVQLTHDEVFAAMALANTKGPVQVIVPGDATTGEWLAFQRELDAAQIRWSGGPPPVPTP